MANKIISRIKKYILRPDLVVGFIWDNMKFGCRYYKFLYNARVSNNHIKHNKNITFYQKTIFTGKGTFEIGNNITFGTKLGGYYHKGLCELQSRYEDSKIVFGSNISTNNNLLIISAKEIIIDDDTLIGEGVMMIDHDGHGIPVDQRRTSIGIVSPIKIGKNVWIGSRATILAGTKIGDNSIVGAGSIVKGEFPQNSIIAGNPAKIIKSLI